jgi:hypothetical protein
VIRKDFLGYIEYSISHDSFIGSTISTRSRKSVSCAGKISSPSARSHDTKASKVSKVSKKENPHDFYPKNFNHVFLPKHDFEGYRNNAKKEFEENQDYVGKKIHQDPERTRTMSDVNDERHQVLSSEVIRDEAIVCLEAFRHNVEGHYGQISAGYFLIQVSRKHI